MAKIIKITEVDWVTAVYPNGDKLRLRRPKQNLPDVIRARDGKTTIIASSGGQKFAVVAPQSTITEDALSSVEEVVNDWFSHQFKKGSVAGETITGISADHGIFMAQPAGAEEKERITVMKAMKKWLKSATNGDGTKNPPAGAEGTTKNPPAGAENTTKNPPAGAEGTTKNPPAGTPGKGVADFQAALARIRNNRG